MEKNLIVEISKIRKIMGLCEDFTEKTLDVNNDEYNLYFDYYGNSSKSLMWMTKGSQNKNFKMVFNHIDENDSLLDYGCGMGDFTKYLKDKDKKISKYLGVDINKKLIKSAKKKYSNYDFKLIESIDDLSGKWDTVCAIGVFTWYIPKKQFIDIINKLYGMCNKQLLLTLNKGKTPYSSENYSKKDEEDYWKKEYRPYNKKLFEKLFPDFKIEYEYNGKTMLVKITK